METLLGVDLATWWFLVVGACFTGYAILDGFDLGAGALHLNFKKEKSRRIALNAIGPVWDGNEVWLVIGGGTLFAGYPVFYANMFSAFYIPFMLFLILLIFRGISIEFRSKEPMAWWRQMWDVAYSVSSYLLALALGVVLGNVLQGIPMNAQMIYEGNGLDFVNPFALMVGVSILTLFTVHGSNYLLLKTEGRLYAKLTKLNRNWTIAFVVSFAVTSLYALIYIPHLSDRIAGNPLFFGLPALVFLSIANMVRLNNKRNYKWAFIFSGLTIAFALILVAVELYPTLLYNSALPEKSITIYNAAASDKSLTIMLTIAAIGAPLAALYSGFVFYTFRGKVELDENSY